MKHARDEKFAAAIMGATIGKTFDFPMVLWGPPYDASLDSVDSYPTALSVTYSAYPYVSYRPFLQ